MKIFVLSLKRATERRKRITEHLQARNISYELFDAVDGTLLTEDEMEKLCDMDVVKRNHTWLTKGMIGACLSHYNIYKKIIEQKIPYACVIEDDVAIDADFSAVLDKVEPLINDKQFILMHYTSWQNMELLPIQKSLYKNYGLYEMGNLEGLNSAACYVLNNETAHKLFSLVLPIRMGPDSWTEFARGGAIPKIYAVYPKPAIIVYAKSTIDYIETKSFAWYLSNFVNDYKIFPLYQLLKYRRKRLYNKMNHIQIVGQ
jgi:glycosyl transferase family 25